MLQDFNLLATTARGNERQMIYEILYLLKEILGDQLAEASKTGVRGLIVARTALNPCEVIEKFKAILHERPYEFRYALRILPIEKVVATELEAIETVAADLASGIGEYETFRITVEKRFTTLHAQEIVEAVATRIDRRVNLDNPDKVLLIEIVGKFTGVSVIKPDLVLSVPKEKML
ncbi:MAG TPA: THUMP domain-containing protein [Candidatus Bathyarchaeia archaeon]|nr:THUMP domain-containing protein [Candidatus Bathyarchaeia archaeon]